MDLGKLDAKSLVKDIGEIFVRTFNVLDVIGDSAKQISNIVSSNEQTVDRLKECRRVIENSQETTKQTDSGDVEKLLENKLEKIITEKVEKLLNANKQQQLMLYDENTNETLKQCNNLRQNGVTNDLVAKQLKKSNSFSLQRQK